MICIRPHKIIAFIVFKESVIMQVSKAISSNVIDYVILDSGVWYSDCDASLDVLDVVTTKSDAPAVSKEETIAQDAQ